MTWIAPQPPERVDPPPIGDERTLVEHYLDYHRRTLLLKCGGLTAEQLVLRAAPPSTMTLLGLVRHLAEVERSWFRRRLSGEKIDFIYCDVDANPDGDFDDVDPAHAERDFGIYLREVDRARAAAAGRSLEDTFVHQYLGVEMSLRWTYLHMLEEYARHNGHADLLRERIDGATGE